MGQFPYAASKIGADQIALSFWHSFNLPITVIRPFNAYGPRQSTRAVIPTIITQIASGKRCISLGSITPTRDFNFVLDICSAFYCIAESEKTIGKVINAASNFEISIGDTARLIAEVMNVEIDFEIDEKRFRPEGSEVNRLFGDNTLIKSLTNWNPSYSGIDGFKRGLLKTSEWFSNPINLNKYKVNNYSI